jgi:hypothetical protein
MPLDQMTGSMPKAPQVSEMHMMMRDQASSTNLLNILFDIAFGFVGGLMYFFGPQAVLAYGTQLAMALIKQTGYGQGPLASFGFTAAPYVILLPIGGFSLKELASVRTIRGFLYFLGAVLIGIAIAYVTKGYFATIIK